jgi:hypothetical protein
MAVSYVEAAVQVLKAVGRPLTTTEITEFAVARRLIDPKGKTPNRSMAARLYLHIRDARPPHIRKTFIPGKARAKRGSVRWTLVRKQR